MSLSMTKKNLIIIGIVLLWAILIVPRILSTRDQGVSDETPENKKVVKTAIVGQAMFFEDIHLVGRVASAQEVTINAQGSGILGSLLVKPGDSLFQGQTIGRIDDTFWTNTNALLSAQIGITNAGFSQTNTLTALQQAVDNARLSLEKAQSDYDAIVRNSEELLTQAENNASAAQIDGNTLSKAQLDYNNYVAAQNKQLEAFETSYKSQFDAFQNLLTNIIDTTDTLLGVSTQKENLNDSYEYLLGALDSRTKTEAMNALSELLAYNNWSQDPMQPLLNRVTELQHVQDLANEVLAKTEMVLIKSVTDSSVFSEATLGGYRSQIDGYQAQYASMSSGLTSFLNSASTFLSTYLDERAARKAALDLAATNAESQLAQTKISVENSLRAAATGLEIANNAYTTATKNLELAQSQTWLAVDLASLQADNAAGNLNRLRITAPISGTVLTTEIETGSLVGNGSIIARIGDTKHTIIRVDVTADQQKFLTRGQIVNLQFRESMFDGTITSISAGPDPQTNLYRVEITPSDLRPEVALGDIVDIHFQGAPLDDNASNIAVPFSALKKTGSTYIVYVIRKDDTGNTTVKAQPVTLGITNSTSALITDGVNLGDRIVVRWTLMLDDGDRVIIDGDENAIDAEAAVMQPATEEEG